MRNRSKRNRQNYQTLEDRRLLAVIVVDTLIDNEVSATDGLVSLREAVLASNLDQPVADAPAGSGADVIQFSPTIEGGTIELKSSLVVSSAVTIEGNVTLDGQGSHRHLKIATTDAVSLNEMTFANGLASHAGSLLLADRVDVTIANATFVNNQATRFSGGAIFQTDGQLSIENSTFEYNQTPSQNGSGGAIHAANGSLQVNESSFFNNSSNGFGGSINAVNVRFLSVANSEFSYSQSSPAARSGGFIASAGESNATVWDSNFRSGWASRAGGAIASFAASLLVKDSAFESNQVSDSIGKGGAIYSTGVLELGQFEEQNGSIEFKNNYASFGGAVFAFSQMSTHQNTVYEANEAKWGGGLRLVNGSFGVARSRFLENVSSERGGAISVATAKLSVFNPDFEGNTFKRQVFGIPVTHRGGAIDAFNTELSIRTNQNSSGFHSNSSVDSGGVLSVIGGSLEISSSAPELPTNFWTGENNSNRTANGGAISAVDSNLNLRNVSFKNFFANRGAALFVRGNDATIVDSEFVSGNGSELGGAIFVSGGSSVNIQGSRFVANAAKENGGAIYVARGAELNITDSSFGSASFENEVDLGSGGAIHNEGVLTVTGTMFSGNRANLRIGSISRGGAISNLGDATIRSSVFRLNRANLGGAVFSQGTLNVSASVFDRNQTEFFDSVRIGLGGAMYLTGETNLESVTYTRNIAGSGGAIATTAGETIGRNLTFGSSDPSDGNEAIRAPTVSTAGLGGAIFVKDLASVVISSSLFENNRSVRLGGAIAGMRAGSNPSIVVDQGSRFIGNRVDAVDVALINEDDESLISRGGAIGTFEANLTVRDAVFSNNRSEEEGGAIFLSIHSNANVLFSDLDSNVSGSRGGAIFNAGELLLADSSVTNNTALNHGGVAETALSETTIERTNFEGNSP